MLYNKNKDKFSDELFKNPTCEYRAAPFWAWNCDLNTELLNKEIDCMKEMGFGGFHMHVRVGMSTEYLSEEFMRLVKNCVEKAKKEKMLAWLYDEDKWPSGFAGGYVTKNPENRQKYIVFSKNPDGGNDEGDTIETLAKYDVTLNSDGYMTSYKKIDLNEKAENPWYAVLKRSETSAWFNMQSYVDTLSPEAITDFINTTHERFKECVGEEFGKTVPAIFTDEPQVFRKRMFGKANDTVNAYIPYTTDFNDTYKKQYGEDLLLKLPELFWELPDGKISVTKYHFHDHVAERFASAFADNIGEWCKNNNIALTGHMMEEPSLRSQNAAISDCMRSYRGFGIPGIDMLCDSRELTTAKQAQSAAHQYGKETVLSELYGVTGWNFKFSGHKLQGDWQAALGINVRVPHLYWVSMHGEAKRDYPASIGHQSPWYKEYRYIEDHFARVNTALTRGKPVVKIGVIHPIESYWIKFGPLEQTSAYLKEADERFAEFIKWMLYGLCDFDYICEGNLPSQQNGVNIGEMKYDTIIVPYCLTLRKTTLGFLKKFKNEGGKVIFAGEVPKYLDAVKSNAPEEFANLCTKVNWSRTDILDAVKENRIIELKKPSGERSDNIIYQLRDDTDCKWLFLANVNNSERYYDCRYTDYTLSLKGEFTPVLYDTITGNIKTLFADYSDGYTFVKLRMYCQDSVLLKLTNGKSPAEYKKEKEISVIGTVPEKAETELSEPNVCVLDMPYYRLDGGDRNDKAEILSICDKLKEKLNYNNAISEGAQPWVFKDEIKEEHTVELEYCISSEIDATDVSLGIEDIEKCKITFNGKEIEKKPNGKYVDDAIDVIPLGKLIKGENTLNIKKSFGSITTLESCYLLGDFGVKLTGTKAVITNPVRELYFGDIRNQGLPFYGGNVTYKFKMKTDENTGICIPHFEQPAVTVDVDGKRLGTIAISPYTLFFDEADGREHEIAITAYGNRFNTFGSIHSFDYANKWHGPGSWRLDEYKQSLQYNLKETGIITAPLIVISI